MHLCNSFKNHQRVQYHNEIDVRFPLREAVNLIRSYSNARVFTLHI